MIKLPSLHRLILQSTPLLQKEAIFQIQYRLANQIIREKIVIIPGLEYEWRTAGEHGGEIVAFVEGGVGLVELVIVSFVEFCFADGEFEVGVGFAADVSAGELAAVEEVDSDYGFFFVLEHALESDF